MLTDFKVKIKKEVLEKIMFFVDRSHIEISGLGMVEEIDGELVVTDAILLKQVNTSTETDIDADDINRAMFLTKDMPGELRFWWHSHVNMGAFWSGTDHATIEQLGQDGWFISTVFNKKRETKTCFYQAKPFPMFVDDLDLKVASVTPKEISEQWEKEYLAKCSVREYQGPKGLSASASEARGVTRGTHHYQVGQEWNYLEKRWEYPKPGGATGTSTIGGAMNNLSADVQADVMASAVEYLKVGMGRDDIYDCLEQEFSTTAADFFWDESFQQMHFGEI